MAVINLSGFATSIFPDQAAFDKHLLQSRDPGYGQDAKRFDGKDI